MQEKFNTQYPSVRHLKARAKKRTPSFSFDYLEGGCSDERALQYANDDFASIRMKQDFVRPIFTDPDIKANFCGIDYAMPFGVAPIGYQGIIWPNAPVILARAAKKYNIPYVLSTMSTSAIEEIATASEGDALFQLYNPSDHHMRHDIIRRLKETQYRALIVTADVPTLGYRPRDIKNGFSLPPAITPHHIWQVITHPVWAWESLLAGGVPTFKNLEPYMGDGSWETRAQIMAEKMIGGVATEELKELRDAWDAPLIVKGVLTEHDMEKCLEIGVDGVVVSSHGARQFDAGVSSISVLPSLVKKYGKRIHISFDSGLQSGTDIAGALACGAQMTFLGRAFTYGVCALGKEGGDHTIEMLQRQLVQAMCQMGCTKIADLPKFLVKQ